MTSSTETPAKFHDFCPLDNRGEPIPMSKYKNKWVLVVNTASKCGFTPQFKGLEKMYQDVNREDDRLAVLGFPCNQFGHEEPGTDDEVKSFCQVNYGVTFPIFKKIDVNGEAADPLFEWLKAEKPGLLGMKRIKWNFEKFLIDPDGKVVQRWASTTTPETIEGEIVKKIALKAAEK